MRRYGFGFAAMFDGFGGLPTGVCRTRVAGGAPALPCAVAIPAAPSVTPATTAAVMMTCEISFMPSSCLTRRVILRMRDSPMAVEVTFCTYGGATTPHSAHQYLVSYPASPRAPRRRPANAQT